MARLRSGRDRTPWYTVTWGWARQTRLHYYALKLGPVDFCVYHKGGWHLSVRWVGTQTSAWILD